MFEQEINEFVSTKILERHIKKGFLNKLCALDLQDEYYETRKNYLQIQKKKS